jgi:hypothetical protein
MEGALRGMGVRPTTYKWGPMLVTLQTVADAGTRAGQKRDLAATRAPEFNTGQSKLLDALAKHLKEEPTAAIKACETRVVLDELTEDPTALNPYQPEEVRVGWMGRVLGWFRRS